MGVQSHGVGGAVAGGVERRPVEWWDVVTCAVVALVLADAA